VGLLVLTRGLNVTCTRIRLHFRSSSSYLSRPTRALSCCSALVVRVFDPLLLETYAVREALALAADLNLHHVQIASDCQVLIKEIHQGSSGKNAAILREISLTAREFQSCNFVFENRNFNFEAHV
jgi:hypothetical protein